MNEFQMIYYSLQIILQQRLIILLSGATVNLPLTISPTNTLSLPPNILPFDVLLNVNNNIENQYAIEYDKTDDIIDNSSNILATRIGIIASVTEYGGLLWLFDLHLILYYEIQIISHQAAGHPISPQTKVPTTTSTYSSSIDSWSSFGPTYSSSNVPSIAPATINPRTFSTSINQYPINLSTFCETYHKFITTSINTSTVYSISLATNIAAILPTINSTTSSITNTPIATPTAQPTKSFTCSSTLLPTHIATSSYTSAPTYSPSTYSPSYIRIESIPIDSIMFKSVQHVNKAYHGAVLGIENNANKETPERHEYFTIDLCVYVIDFCLCNFGIYMLIDVFIHNKSN